MEITTPTSSNDHLPPSLSLPLPQFLPASSPSSLKDHSPQFLPHQSPPCGVIQRCGCQWVWLPLFWHCRQAGWGSSHPFPRGPGGSQPWMEQRTDPATSSQIPECVTLVCACRESLVMKSFVKCVLQIILVYCGLPSSCNAVQKPELKY